MQKLCMDSIVKILLELSKFSSAKVFNNQKEIFIIYDVENTECCIYNNIILDKLILTRCWRRDLEMLRVDNSNKLMLLKMVDTYLMYKKKLGIRNK